MKRALLPLLLAAVLLLTSCAGNTPAPQATAQPSQPVSISIGYWNIDRMNDIQHDAMREYVQTSLGITIQPVSVDWTNYKVYYEMLSTTDSLPDVFTTLTISSTDANDNAFYESLIEQGRIQPLPEDLSPYPNLQRAMEQVGYTAWKDGRYYALPRLSFLNKDLSGTDAAMLVRKDWMENLGLTVPGSLEDFVALAAAFASDDPDGNGIDDTIGYNVNSLSALGKWVILGIQAEYNTYGWVFEDGRYIPSWYSSGFDRVVEALHTLYVTGGLDPEFYAKNPTEVLVDFASGRLGLLEYKSSPSAINEVAELWPLYNEKPFEECVAILPIFPDENGTKWRNTSLPFWSQSFISSKVDAEKLDRILRLFDYLLSDEGLMMSKFGLAGVDYTEDEQGRFTVLLELGDRSLSEVLMDKYPSLALFSGLATWGGTDADFVLNEMNAARYGADCMQIANAGLVQMLAETQPVQRPEEFLILPKQASQLFSTSTAFRALVNVIISDGDPLTQWHQVIEQMRADGIEDYIQRQNNLYALQQQEKQK